VSIHAPYLSATPADSPLRILLAEDDDQIRNTILRGLRERSPAVDVVADGEE
jgi:CheY-like chemotaxis protein